MFIYIKSTALIIINEKWWNQALINRTNTSIKVSIDHSLILTLIAHDLSHSDWRCLRGQNMPAEPLFEEPVAKDARSDYWRGVRDEECHNEGWCNG